MVEPRATFILLIAQKVRHLDLRRAIAVATNREWVVIVIVIIVVVGLRVWREHYALMLQRMFS